MIWGERKTMKNYNNSSWFEYAMIHSLNNCGHTVNDDQKFTFIGLY